MICIYIIFIIYIQFLSHLFRSKYLRQAYEDNANRRNVTWSVLWLRGFSTFCVWNFLFSTSSQYVTRVWRTYVRRVITDMRVYVVCSFVSLFVCLSLFITYGWSIFDTIVNYTCYIFFLFLAGKIHVLKKYHLWAFEKNS